MVSVDAKEMIKAFCSITVPTLNLAETKNGMLKA